MSDEKESKKDANFPKCKHGIVGVYVPHEEYIAKYGPGWKVAEIACRVCSEDQRTRPEYHMAPLPFLPGEKPAPPVKVLETIQLVSVPVVPVTVPSTYAPYIGPGDTGRRIDGGL